MSSNEGLLNCSGISLKNLKMQYDQSHNKIPVGPQSRFGLGELIFFRLIGLGLSFSLVTNQLLFLSVYKQCFGVLQFNSLLGLSL